MRQIVLDTETTGLHVEEGHRIIEIGCLEMIDRKITGNQFHYYINPEREVEADALSVHGVNNAFLKDKPLFNTIAKEFIDFIMGAELVIHNAPFDLSFLNNELMLSRQGFKPLTEYCAVIDTLQIARQLHVGQRNSLDALCKRYSIDNSKRDLHGALLDAHLLMQVYLAMTGGQGSFFDGIQHQPISTHSEQSSEYLMIESKHLIVQKADQEELIEHKIYLDLLKKQGKCIWDDNRGEEVTM